MRPTPAAQAWINGFVGSMPGGWSGNADAAILSAANAATVPNPVAQPQIQAPYNAQQLLGSLSQSSAQSLESFPGISQLYDDILAQNSGRVLATVALLTTSGRILSTEAATITTAVNATIPDPSWPARIGEAQASLGRPLDLGDLAATRPQGT